MNDAKTIIWKSKIPKILSELFNLLKDVLSRVILNNKNEPGKFIYVRVVIPCAYNPGGCCNKNFPETKNNSSETFVIVPGISF
jgi:hypothetical protein